jgi:hypothetical protein
VEVRKNMRNSVAKPNDQISKNNDLDPCSTNTIQNFRQNMGCTVNRNRDTCDSHMGTTY